MIVQVKITGRVQGVCFRAWAQEEAELLGLSGWVKNCHDGSVEAHFEGEDAVVEEMLRRCHEGPPLAKVTSVAVTPMNESCGKKEFRVVY